jgi:alanine-synthesizing transaminase
VSGRQLVDHVAPGVHRMEIMQLSKLTHVAYVRGPVLEEAMRLEAESHRILWLNIGNPAQFGFAASD